jgi:anti-sigma regulatory factor (Ser/Thr protein kinase)
MKRESWLPAAPESAPIARAIVREAALEHGMDRESSWDLMLATTEAVSNAIVHGTACENGDKGILLRVLPGQDCLYVEVCDCGEFESTPEAGPPEEATSGRGIPIIAAVVDHFELIPDPCRTRVRFGKRLSLVA